MASLLRHRAGHYLVLLLSWAALTLPNLGAPSLWDNDEGLNAEAAREMYESGDWVVPRFNFQLRDAKPALLYWLQAASFHALGVSEFAARLPSALAALVAVLAVYELGRSMFSPATGFFSGVALISSILLCSVAHFANPDSLLLACTSLTFLAFWRGFAPSRPGEPPRRGWFIPFGLACGLGVLTKGPVALALPGLVLLIFLAWQRQLRCLLDRRLFLGAVAFMAVALPWYLMVTVETRGAYFRGFIFNNNVNRYLAPVGDHSGPVYYHPLILVAGFAPWSVFILPTFWYAIRDCRPRPEGDFRPEGDRIVTAQRLLLCWFVTYLVFFTGSATKLPGYTLPLYPALALLTGRFLDGWRRGEFRPSRWVMGYSFLWLAALGPAAVAIVFVTGGAWHISNLALRPEPTLINWAWLGLIPVGAAAMMAILAALSRRGVAIAFCFALAVIMLAVWYGRVIVELNRAKAPRELIAAAQACRRDQDVRLATYQYMQPSLVFYGQRAVQPLQSESEAVQFLACPTPAFLFIPKPDWEKMQGRLSGYPVASHWDLYRNCEIVVISNSTDEKLASRK